MPRVLTSTSLLTWLRSGVRSVFSRAFSKTILNQCLDFHQIPDSHANSPFFAPEIFSGKKNLKRRYSHSSSLFFQILHCLESSKKLRGEV